MTYRIRIRGVELEQALFMDVRADREVDAMAIAQEEADNKGLAWDVLEMVGKIREMRNDGTKFYQVSCNRGCNRKVILARSRYEAIGYYLAEEVENIGSEYVDRVEILPPDYQVNVSRNGNSVRQTLEEIYKENPSWAIPIVVARLEQ